MGSFITNLIPGIVKVLDLIPFKGWRTVVFGGLLIVNLALEQLKVLPADISTIITTSLLPLITYFAAKHTS